ncbi:MAG: outer membrane protein assembly factor BamB family protein [Ktedonobacterales bacterium]
MHQNSPPSLDEVTLNRCQAPPPVPVVTTLAPVRAHQSLYLAAGDCLYAVNAGDGTARWCQQVKLTRTREVSYPPPPRLTFGAPRVVHGVLYVGVDGYGEYTYAFNADDGSLRWRTPTDARVAAMPFLDWAVPLVKDRIVYSGTYALNEQDGTVLWRLDIDTRVEGTLSLHALTDDTIYATTHRGIYAINAQGGQIRWLYQPDEQSIVSGPPVVADRLLYAGTSGSVWYPEKSHLFALDVETGAEIWRYPVGGYIGAVVHNETIYVSSGDRFLYALDTSSGMLRWRYPFAAPGHYPATIAENVLYIATDGAYALSSEDGTVLWRQPLGSSPSMSFRQPALLGGAVYLVRIDGHGRGVLYALNTRNGAEYWHTLYPSGSAPLAVAQ